MIASLFRVILGMSLTGGAITLAWLLLSLVGRRHCSSRWHRRISLVVLGFYAAPVGLLLARITPALFAAEGEALIDFPPPLALVNLPQSPPAGLTAASFWQTLPSYLPALWLIVTLLLLGWRLTGMIRFRQVLRNSGTPLEATQLPDHSFPLRVWMTPGIGTPMLAGILRPILFLPDASWDKRELALVLRHELTHYRHGDMPVKLCCLLLRSIHWFNPLVYLLTNLLDQQLELACDEAVTEEMDLDSRKAYGIVILNTLEQSTPKKRHSFAALGGEGSGIKERLMAIINRKSMSKKAKILSGAAMALLCIAGIGAANLLYIPVEAAALDDGPHPMRVPPTEEALIAADPEIVEAEAWELTPATDDASQGPKGFLWPVESGYISADLDGYPGHTGIDIAGPLGDNVYATASGKVVMAKRTTSGYGIYTVIDHGDGYQSLYGQLDDLYVQDGDIVTQGQVIAARGKSGNSTGSHLHFELRLNGSIENPLDYVSEP